MVGVGWALLRLWVVILPEPVHLLRKISTVQHLGSECVRFAEGVLSSGIPSWRLILTELNLALLGGRHPHLEGISHQLSFKFSLLRLVSWSVADGLLTLRLHLLDSLTVLALIHAKQV